VSDPTELSLASLRFYFNSQRAGIDAKLTERLVTFIADTHSTLDVAIYDLTQTAVLAALQTVANDPGRRLRIAFDASGEQPTSATVDPKPGKTHAAIEAAGLMPYATPVYVKSSHLMHDKFAIRDAKALWTGSANFTEGGLSLQDNTCLVADSITLAKLYQPVFDALLSQPTAPVLQAAPKPVALSGAEVSVYFAPGAGEGIDELCTRLTSQAQKVRLMAFVITDPDILGSLRRFSAQGEDFEAIVDPAAISTAKKITSLDPALFWWTHDPRVRIAPSHAFTATGDNDFQHNKVLVLDDQRIVCGSYNLSENAEANDENLLLIESAEIAQAYHAYFDAVYATGRPSA
jgi:phosphatidylserine/phosphatidylglycerophosphate/cardiolipin synthase-like enzyme